LEPKVTKQFNGKTYTEKNYSGLEPVTTLVWMVDDTFNFTDDFVAFTTLPEAAKTFISDENLWQQPIETILTEREKALNIINNKTKDLGFFTENRLVYAFQKNIVNNKKNSNYFKWFDLANKSRKTDNVEEDFSQFNNDEIMAEVIKRLKKDKLTTEEYKFVSDLPLYEAYYGNLQQELEEKNQQKLQEKEQRIQAEHQKLLKGIENLLRRGETIESIAELLDRSVDEITDFVAEINAKKA
jgi:hypothetical protein